MKKIVKKTKKLKKLNKDGRFLVTFFLFGGLILTVAALLSPQYIRQFAQYSAPPLFGCLHTGAADPTNCGTRMGNTGEVSFSLYGRPVADNNPLVYYNDTLSGSYDYSNTGDQPIAIKSMGIAGGALSQYYVADFDPLQGPTTIQPKQSVTIKTASHQFGDPDPNGSWVIGAGLTDTSGQHLPVDTSTTVKVVAACTALRVLPLTSQDKSDVQSLCKNNPTNSLCTSKQYCQIFKGGSCPQADVSPDDPGQQCDDAIVLAKPEQDMLEQLCTTYPDADACQDFCDRSIGSSICPQVMVDDAGDPIAEGNSSSDPTGNIATEAKAVVGASIGPQIAVANCMSPLSTDPTKCNVCTSGYITTPEGSCVASTNGNNTSTVGSDSSGNVKNCATATPTCTQCATGYTLTGSGVCIATATPPAPAPAPAPKPAPVVPAPPAPAAPPPPPKPAPAPTISTVPPKSGNSSTKPNSNGSSPNTGSSGNSGTGKGNPSSGTNGGGSGTPGGSKSGGTGGNASKPKKPTGKKLTSATSKKNGKVQSCALHTKVINGKCKKSAGKNNGKTAKAGKGIKGGKGSGGVNIIGTSLGNLFGRNIFTGSLKPPIVPPNYNVPVGGFGATPALSNCLSAQAADSNKCNVCVSGYMTAANGTCVQSTNTNGGDLNAGTNASGSINNCKNTGTPCTACNAGYILTASGVCIANKSAVPAPGSALTPVGGTLPDGVSCTPANDQCAKKDCDPKLLTCGGI